MNPFLPCCTGSAVFIIILTFFRWKNQWGKNDIKGKFIPEFKIYCGCNKKSIFFRVQTEFVSLQSRKMFEKKISIDLFKLFLFLALVMQHFHLHPHFNPIHSIHMRCFIQKSSTLNGYKWLCTNKLFVYVLYILMNKKFIQISVFRSI